MSMPLTSLDLIPAFCAVLEHGSLSGAARALGLSQPTVRRQIETLEAELGARLFTRAQNGLTATPLALRLREPAQAVLDQAHGLRRMVDRGAQVAGAVRLTCPRVMAVHVVPPLLAELRALHPGLVVELAATDSTEDLLHRAADVAIRVAPLTQKALVARTLPEVELGLFRAAGLAEPADLVSAPFIDDDRIGQIAPWLAARGLAAPRNVVLRTDDALVQIAAIAAGMGVGLCQAGIAARLGFVRVLREVTVQMPCAVAMHEDQRASPAVRALFDHLVAGLPGALKGRPTRPR
ncbi:LysR family transcriptional regulator [Pseudosulfitobacter koreensis]|nr:LysR family transcriptional regulator [Pseudosulfitobacter koreense]